MTRPFGKQDWLAALLLMAVVLFFHLRWIQVNYHVFGHAGPDPTYEGAGAPQTTDYAYYVNGAISILQFDIEKKFNDKSQPIIQQPPRRIVESDMPRYAKYVLALYPNSSFKFGTSLTMALLTAPFPTSLFVTQIPRLAFTNVILNFGMVLLVFLSVRRLAGSPWPALMAALFVGLDYSLIHNSYAYQSHTTVGLFYFFVAFYLFTAEKISVARFFWIAFALGTSAVSSSHVYPQIMVLGILVYLRATWGTSIANWIRCALAGAAGMLIWPIYIVTVEHWFHFERLGIPTFFKQQLAYMGAVESLRDTVPVGLRFMWDLRIFDFFWPLIILLFCLLLGYVAWRFRPRIAYRDFGRGQGGKIAYLGITLVISLLMTAFTSQPVTRAATPDTVLFGLMVGYGFGRLLIYTPVLGAVTSAAVVAMMAINCIGLQYLTSQTFTANEFFTLARRPPEDKTFFINDVPAIIAIATKYGEADGKVVLDGSEYAYVNKTIGQFLDIIDAKAKQDHVNYDWVFFDPIWFTHAYANTRQFWPEFTPLKINLARPEILARDFRLINQIFAAIGNGGMHPDDVIVAGKLAWNFAYFDQENTYPLAYFGRVRRFMGDLPMAGFDPHAAYYFRVDALRRVAAGAAARS
jgi:hypothetical protein